MPVPVLAGAAVMSDNLVDNLVPDVIDGLRDALYPDFGVRAYRVYRVIRTWTGDVPGEGTYTDDAAELRPQPRVLEWSAMQRRLAAAGMQDLGEVMLEEVSLTYTESQLTGRGALAANQQQFIAIGEANGQLQPSVLYTHARPPYCDRMKSLGWVVYLTRAEGEPWP
jgi:hypothetical protein